jgi:hypothetical protein
MLTRQWKLPIVLFSKTSLKQLFDVKPGFDFKWLLMGGGMDQKFWFIRSPVNVVPDVIPSYSLIEQTFAFSEIPNFQNMIRSARFENNSKYKTNIQLLTTYLQTPSTTVSQWAQSAHQGVQSLTCAVSPARSKYQIIC